MPQVPGLRSPYSKVGRLVYFGRMLDKIRLHAAGRLPAEYIANLGETRPLLFDARCCRFLGVTYDALGARTRQGGADEEILGWAHRAGCARSDEECEIWNRYMMKLGWCDDVSARLQMRLAEAGLAGRGIQTFFAMIDADEGREPPAGPAA